MLNERATSFAKECPKGSIRVVVSERTSIDPSTTGGVMSGLVQLRQRIDNVIGIRVLSIALSQTNPLAQYDGGLIALGSNTLGACMKRSPFILAPSSETGASTGISFSNVIALSSTCRTNMQLASPVQENNPRIEFTSAKSVDNFDWQVGAVNGTLLGPAPFALEFIIEFYTLCQC
jgi:hypothetical protein